MARAVRLDALRAQVRRRADQESGGQASQQLCTDAELNDYINAAWCELYELLIGWGQEYYLSSSSITTVSGTDTYALPDDFYKMRGLDVTIAPGWVVTGRPFMFEDRNAYKLTPTVWSLGEPVYYRLRASSLAVVPSPTGVFTMTLWYYPVPATLISDANTIDGVNGWDDFVVVTAAKKAATKEENVELAGMLENERQQLIVRIQNHASWRDAGAPERVQDVSGGGAWD